MPDELVQTVDRLAALLDRPRSWVMLRALRQYLEDEGAEIVEDAESLAELDRGEIVAAEDVRQRVEEIITRTKSPCATEMTSRVGYSRHAAAEVEEITAFLAEHSRLAAERFSEALRRA